MDEADKLMNNKRNKSTRWPSFANAARKHEHTLSKSVSNLLNWVDLKHGLIQPQVTDRLQKHEDKLRPLVPYLCYG